VSSQAHRLLLTCPDRPGIVAAVAGLLADRQVNIVEADQHSEPDEDLFAMRLEFTLPSDIDPSELEHEFAERVGRPLSMRWHFAAPNARPRVAVLCSRESHCLLDLLWRAAHEELPGQIVVVISTCDSHRQAVAAFDVPFECHEVGQGGMSAHEEALLTALVGQVDLVVLARYMRVLSGAFLDRLAVPAINIHHSFLPAFAGANPYVRAHQRGVKLIGATAHYVTEELDAGPIICQDVVRVSHRQSAEDLERIGRDVERVVLANAVRAHLEDRVALCGVRTVVF